MPVLEEEDLVGLAGSIWETVLGRAVEPIEAEGAAAAIRSGVSVTACVAITGEWEGTVAIVLPLAGAVRVASDMFGMGEDELDDELVHDACGELANIAAGNIKGMLTADTKLGLPTVVRGSEYSVTVPRAHVVCEAAFECDGLPFHVVVKSPTDLPVTG